jgi:hypothetical protein
MKTVGSLGVLKYLEPADFLILIFIFIFILGRGEIPGINWFFNPDVFGISGTSQFFDSDFFFKKYLGPVVLWRLPRLDGY